MAKSAWTKQSTVASSTPRTLPRIQWLRGQPTILAAMDRALTWLRTAPTSGAITAAFLNELSTGDVDALLELRDPGSSTDPDRRPAQIRRIKQELGLLVPILLSERFGPAHVETLRDSRSHAAAPRKIPPEFRSLTWVTNYTPHRLTAEGRHQLAQPDAPIPAKAGLPGLRGRVGFEGRYEEIIREERNLAAILYAALQHSDNLRRLLVACNIRIPLEELPDHAVFFEFAMARDLWSTQVSGDNDLARAVILEHLAPCPAEWSTCSIEDFNRAVGVPRPSATTIQMPARWSIPRMAEQMDGELLSRACTFKWAFNAKPDLVVRLGRNRALCIEMKLESGVGSYPSSTRDVAVFEERGLARQLQTDVQRYLMEDLLGFDTRYVLLTAAGTEESSTHLPLGWRELFSWLDLREAPAFARRTIAATLARTPSSD